MSTKSKRIIDLTSIEFTMPPTAYFTMGFLLERLAQVLLIRTAER